MSVRQVQLAAILVSQMLPLLLIPSGILAFYKPFELSPLVCNTEIEWPQPIAIYLELDSMSQLRTHTHTQNVSVLAKINVSDRSLNLTGYKQTVEHQREQYIKSYMDAVGAASCRFRHVISPVKWVLKELSGAAGLILERFSRYETEGLLAGLDESRVWWKYPVWLSAQVATYEYRQVSRFIKLAAKKTGWTVPRLELYHVHNELKQALKLIKERAYNNTGVEIFSALIVYPEFFNPEARNLVPDSASQAGIRTLALDPLTRRDVVERYANILLFNKTRSDELDGWGKQPSILLLDQGLSHFGLMTSGTHLIMNHPIEPMSCWRIWANLRARLYERNADILAEVTEADSVNRLGQEVMAAREVLKTCQECEHQGPGAEGQLAEGIMLGLDDWWTSEERKQPVSLLWEDVEAADEEYVEKLVEWVDDVQLQLQEVKGSPELFDAVVIIGAFCDGTLLTRAIKRSMGEYVPTFGFSASSQGYMVQLGARDALEIRQEVSGKLQEECGRQAKEVYQYQQELRRRQSEARDGYSDAGHVRYGRDEL